MSDIFISYAREDRWVVKALASAFKAEGWTVWWDHAIPPGKTWDEVLERELLAARCVVVVWSANSVKSQWVRAEAAEGLKRGILVPVRLDETELPLQFRQVQTANLIGWAGEVSHPDLAITTGAIAAILFPQQQLRIDSNFSKSPGEIESTTYMELYENNPFICKAWPSQVQLPEGRTWDNAELREVNKLRKRYANQWSSISENYDKFINATDEHEKEKLYEVHKERMYVLYAIKRELESHGFDQSAFFIPVRMLV